MLWWHQVRGYWTLTYQFKNEDGVMIASHVRVGKFSTDVDAISECEKLNSTDSNKYYSVLPVIDGDNN